MNIFKKVIPNQEQRYPTVGDWWVDENGDLQIRVSAMGNPKYEFLVGYHEEAEAVLCIARGIDEKEITEFDIKYENDRDAGLHSDEDDPGFDPDAPYRMEHHTADIIEFIMAHELGVNAGEYGKTVMEL